MSRRGLTLLEMLLAISLLSGLALSAVAWTSSVARQSVTEQDRAGWSSAARATLRMIGDDIACGDLERRAADREGDPSWLGVDDAELRIQIRHAPFSGSEYAVYAFDRSSGQLVRTVESDDVHVHTQLLLGEVSEFGVLLVEPGPEPDEYRYLGVTLRSRTGDEFLEEFLLVGRGDQ